MDSKLIAREFVLVYKQLKGGIITPEEAKLQQSLLTGMLKAYEQAELQEKVDRIEAILEGRS